MLKSRILSLSLLLSCCCTALNAAVILQSQDGKMSLKLDGMTIKSLIINGKERLKAESAIEIIALKQNKALQLSDIKLEKKAQNRIALSGKTSIGNIALDLKAEKDNIKISIHGKFTEPATCKFPVNAAYDKISYIRFDSSVSDWSPEKMKKRGISYLDDSIIFTEKKAADKFTNIVMRQCPVAVMTFPDKSYFALERTTSKDFKNGYTIMAISGGIKDSKTFEADFRNSDPSGKTIDASIVLRSGNYKHDAYIQSCLDARQKPYLKEIPNNAIFVREERGLRRGLKQTDRVVIAEWSEAVMSFDGVPIKHSSYEAIREKIIAGKKRFPNLKALVYWSPTLYRNDPLYNYTTAQQQIFKDAFINNKSMQNMFIIYHGLFSTPNYFMDMSPDKAYGKMLLKNVTTLLEKIPEADGLFWDNFFYGATFYAQDYDYKNKKSSIIAMAKFIKGLRLLPAMQDKLICANGGLEPETASQMDCFVTEPSRRGTMLYYSMRFGKPMFHLRKLGYLSLSDAQFWNVLPNGSDVSEHGSFPPAYDVSVWPKTVDSKAQMLSPYLMYYPEVERYVLLARKFYLDQSDLSENMTCETNKNLKELTFTTTGKIKGPFYVEYLHSPDSEISAYQKYSQIRRFFFNPEKVILQPHTAAVIEPLKLNLKLYWDNSNGKTGVFLVPSHHSKVLNGLKISVSANNAKGQLVEQKLDYVKVNKKEGYFAEIPQTLRMNSLSVKLDSNGEIIERKISKPEAIKSTQVTEIQNKLKALKAEAEKNKSNIDYAKLATQLKEQKGKKENCVEMEWLNKKSWRPGSPRITLSEKAGMLKFELANNHNFRWSNSVNKDFSRWPGADWTAFKGVGVWLYPLTNDFAKIKLTILRSYGAVRNKERISELLKLKPNKWNYFYIDFKKYKFDLKDVWRFQFALDGHWFKDKTKSSILFGGFELFKK